jgi:Tripartite tricarboxylate transporter family receptor
MRAPLICFSISLVSLFSVIDQPVQAKDYPTRAVKIVVPYPPGGAVDVMARLIAQKLSDGLGGQFYVENLSGAGGDIGMGAVATAPADGQTILFVSPDFIVRPLVKSKVPYDPIASFAPVTLVANSPAVISIHPSVPAKNMNELLALLKSNPGKYTLATPGYGTVPDLEGERLYKLFYGLDALVAPYIKDGTLRALACYTRRSKGSHRASPLLLRATPQFWAPRYRLRATDVLQHCPMCRPSTKPVCPIRKEASRAESLSRQVHQRTSSTCSIARSSGSCPYRT